MKALFGISQRIVTNKIRLETKGLVKGEEVRHQKVLGSQLLMRHQDL